MAKSKKVWIILLVILIPLIPFIYIALAWTVVGIGMWVFTPNPARPEETYGEFPFELIYEIDGETITINDIYVCEYDGITCDTGSGKYRTWNGYVKSTGDDVVVLYKDNITTIHCYVGDAEYYMDDEKYPEQRPFKPRFYIGSLPISTDQLLQRYKIRIVSWSLSEPIENSFD